MSEQNPYDQLGVTEDSSFDEIQEAKQRLMQQYSSDRKQQEQVETAYDAILMDRLRMRQEGRIKVPDRIRFPEKLVQPVPTPAPTPANVGRAWFQQFLDTPSRSDVLWPAGIYGTLAVISLLYATRDLIVLQTTLAIGIGSALYFLNRKERKFGRALLLTMTGFVVGLILGTVLGSLLHPALVGVRLNDETFATLVTFVLLWLITSFLR